VEGFSGSFVLGTFVKSCGDNSKYGKKSGTLHSHLLPFCFVDDVKLS
jgi:hypothetical protein